MIVDTADAVRMGYSSTQSKKNNDIYERWKKQLENRIDEINGVVKQQKTLWTSFKRSKRLM